MTGGRAPDAGEDTRRALETLSRREREVLEGMMDGLAAHAIAAQLGTSLSTVRSQIQAVLRKLHAHSQLEAASLAFRHGIAHHDRGGEPTHDRD